jgi:butyrate kinase
LNKDKLLVINPGSTSTKVAVFKGQMLLWTGTLAHSTGALREFNNIIDQFQFRKKTIERAVLNQGYVLEDFKAVVARGGLLKPISGGTYIVNAAMLQDLRNGTYGEHACNLGALIAREIAGPLGINAYIVDPVVVDELEPLARLSGIPEVPRRSIFHALNQKAMARRYCRENNRRYEDVNLLVVHLGGGISVGAHKKGRVIDVTNALDGEGPFSPERAGGIPVVELLKYFIEHGKDLDGIRKRLIGQGGLAAYLKTNDAREVEDMIEKGKEEAALVYEAMAYQIAKEIGAYAAVLSGKIDAIILTGGLAFSSRLTAWIKERVDFIAPVVLYPGEDEMTALVEGVLRVFDGTEEALVY